MLSANMNIASVLLLLCSAGINARMLSHQAATPTPTPTPRPSIDDPIYTPTLIPSSDGRANNKPDMPGSGRDGHGCIPSAGESWCESTKECIRDWNTPCPPVVDETPAMPGSDRDEHGCIPSAGESWCESSKKCIRSWNTPCPVDTPAMPGSDRDEHGCTPSAGETWCKSTEECIQESNTFCPAESDEQHACPSSSPNTIAGGWEDATGAQIDSNVNAAASFILQSLGHEDEAYTVDFACTQVVAGTNFYMVVSLENGGKFTATVYQQLPASNGGDGSYQITSLKYED